MENGVEFYPLTHPQKGIWYTEKMYPGTSIGNIAATLRIKGNVDYGLLERAVNLFIEKNDAARLRVIEENDEPKLYISEYTYHKLDLYDFQDKELTDLYYWEDEQAKKPFDLIDSELVHFDLIKVNDSDGGFYAKMHHLVSDAWTMSLLGNQVIEYYTALKNGEEIPNGMIPSYCDFILSEEEYFKSDRFNKDKEYWNEKFKVCPEKATLKKVNPNEVGTKARRKAMVTPKKLSAKIYQYCSENKTSVYSLLIAALAMYINRITAKENIVFGTTTLNRANAKEKEVVGLFINIAPICLNIRADMNFKTLVEIVSRDGLSLLRHQKYPYDLILKEVRSKHKITGNIFFLLFSLPN
ncbi:MAG TPA: condensation domain-containing protein [Clostridia bacterium]|nr:condensation domain-containing protein [Clostridia bacterium]